MMAADFDIFYVNTAFITADDFDIYYENSFPISNVEYEYEYSTCIQTNITTITRIQI